MAASNRAKLISKLHAALKKKYTVPPAQPSRPLLEHMLYACLLEDAPADLADEGLAKCEQDFYDWNEVRVTTVTELANVLSRLPDAQKAANRLKSNLQSVFEEFYTFDLDHLKKENLGKAVNKFEKMPEMTPFVLSYTIQHGLGGHSIPIDYSAMVIMLNVGIATQPEAASGRVPGLERAIPKNKGIEFSNLLHQAAVALNKDHKDKDARALMDAVAKGSSTQFDEWLASRKAAKRRAVKARAAEKERARLEAEAAAAAAAEAARKEKEKAAKKAAAKLAAEKKAKEKAAAEKQAAMDKLKEDRRKAAEKAAKKLEAEKEARKKAAAKKRADAKAAGAKKKVATKKVTKKTKVAKTTSKKKPVTKKKVTKKSKPTKKVTKKSKPTKKVAKKATTKTTKKKVTKKKSPTKKKTAKSANRKLTRRKPR